MIIEKLSMTNGEKAAEIISGAVTIGSAICAFTKSPLSLVGAMAAAIIKVKEKK